METRLELGNPQHLTRGFRIGRKALGWLIKFGMIGILLGAVGVLPLVAEQEGFHVFYWATLSALFLIVLLFWPFHWLYWRCERWFDEVLFQCEASHSVGMPVLVQFGEEGGRDVGVLIFEGDGLRYEGDRAKFAITEEDIYWVTASRSQPAWRLPRSDYAPNAPAYELRLREPLQEISSIYLAALPPWTNWGWHRRARLLREELRKLSERLVKARSAEEGYILPVARPMQRRVGKRLVLQLVPIGWLVLFFLANGGMTLLLVATKLYEDIFPLALFAQLSVLGLTLVPIFLYQPTHSLPVVSEPKAHSLREASRAEGRPCFTARLRLEPSRSGAKKSVMVIPDAGVLAFEEAALHYVGDEVRVLIPYEQIAFVAERKRSAGLFTSADRGFYVKLIRPVDEREAIIVEPAEGKTLITARRRRREFRKLMEPFRPESV